MPANATTRRGNGGGNSPGYGGPAKGEGKKGPGPGRPPGMKNGEGKKAKGREAIEAAVPAAIATVIAIAKARKDPRALSAAFGILNRAGLHEKSGVELTGADGAPVAVQFYLPDNGRD